MSTDTSLVLNSLEVMDEILEVLYHGNGAIMKTMRSDKEIVDSFDDFINSFNKLYETQARNVVDSFYRMSNQISEKLDVRAYEKCNLIMLKIFQFQIIDNTDEEIPDWMVELIRACSVEDPKICTTSIDRFLFLLKIKDGTKKGCSIMQI